MSSGPVSSGLAVQQGILLADEKYDQNNCIKYIFEDDQLQPKLSINNVNKFINIDRADGLIVYGTPTSLAVSEVSEKHKVPLLALSILDKVVKGKSFTVKHWCNSQSLNTAVVNEAHKRNYSKVAIVSTQNDAMLKLRDDFKSSFKNEIVFDQEFAKDNFDFNTVIQRLIKTKAEAVYLLLYPPQTAPFLQKIKSLGYRGEFFGVHNFEDPAEVKAAAGAMEGLWFANGDDSGGDNFKADFQKRFNAIPAMGAASGYDLAKMISVSARQDLSLNDYVHSLKSFEGAFGLYSATTDNDFDFPAKIKIIRNSQFLLITP